MLSEDLRAKLRQLNQVPAPLNPQGTSVLGGDSRAVSSGVVDADLGDGSQLPAGEELANAWGTHWIRRRALGAIWPSGDHWLNHSEARLDPCRVSAPHRPDELSALLANLPDHVVYLDLETCGFAGSMIFLVGLIHRHQQQFQLVQLLARNYAEEKPMLQTLWSIVAEHRVLATFNGKSFDWPLVHDRSTRHHLGYDARQAPSEELLDNGRPPRTAQLTTLTRHDPRPQLVHCDLLHHARRRWQDQLPNCRLQTLERYICRRHRRDDIPGREIPCAYRDFVRSGDASLIRGVLHHNALDLVTLLQLSMRVLE